MNNDDDQEIFHDAIEFASENFIENHIDSQQYYDKSDVDHNDLEEKDRLVDKLIRKFNKKIVKCQKRIEKANQQSKDFENQNKELQDKYDVLKNQATTCEMNNKELDEQLKELIEKNNDLLAQTKVLKDQLQLKHVVIDTHVECQKKYAKLKAERYENLKNTVLEKDFKISELKECVLNKDLEIEKYLERLNACENKLHKMGQTNQTVHMIMPSKDNLYNGRKGIGFENPSYFEKAKDLRPLLYDEKVIGLGYTPMFLTHSNEALEIEKFKRSREYKIKFAYDYENLNASYVNEKINFEDDYFQEIINPDFEKIDSPFQQTSSLKPYVPNVILENIIIDLEDEVVSLLEKEKANLETIESLKSKGFESSETVISESKNQSEKDCLVVEKECDTEENLKVIAPGMFKLSVSLIVSPISMSKTSCKSNNVEIKLKIKRHKRKSSKQNVKQVNNDVSRANSDFVHFLDLDTFSSVRRPKNSGVIWKKKGSYNTSKVDLSAVRISKLNKNVKRYSRKDLLAFNNSHLGEIGSAFVCNDAMNVSCNSRMCDFLDDNNFFIFNDESVKISPVCKMPFRKKPCDSMNVRSKSNSNKSLPRTIVQICLWIIDSGCLKHMTGKRALLKNFVEKFLGTVRFGNNDFAVIAGYGDVVTDDVDLLTGDRSSNLYTIALNEVASNSLTCLLAKASSSQSWLWHQRLSHLNFATINNLVKNNLVQDEATEVIIYFIKKTQVNLQLQVQLVRTDNGTEFKNKTLAKFFDEVGSTQQFSAARTPQQNGVVERSNRTLVEAAKTMLIFAKLPSFLWAEAIATACFTQNRSIIHKRFDKTPYEIMNKRKPNINFFRVFGCRCYLLNDYEDVGKLKAKGDIGVFVGYSKVIYNKQTRKIHESVNVNFDEISEMASKQFSLEPGLSYLNETGKSLNPSVSKVSEASKKDLEDLFQDFYDEYFDSSKIMKSSTTNVKSSNVKFLRLKKKFFMGFLNHFKGNLLHLH
nr:integrase, catalytic region, zinc finger, CCHC-type, peptidase aspartic, catalytic [Tanacetum cinerariifolium]